MGGEGEVRGEGFPRLKGQRPRAADFSTLPPQKLGGGRETTNPL